MEDVFMIFLRVLLIERAEIEGSGENPCLRGGH